MKALLNILTTTTIFFCLSIIINWILDDPNNSQELLRIVKTSTVFGVLMYPTGRFINRKFGKDKSMPDGDSV